MPPKGLVEIQTSPVLRKPIQSTARCYPPPQQKPLAALVLGVEDDKETAAEQNRNVRNSCGFYSRVADGKRPENNKFTATTLSDFLNSLKLSSGVLSQKRPLQRRKCLGSARRGVNNSISATPAIGIRDGIEMQQLHFITS